MQNFETIRGCIMGSPLSGDDKMALINVFADIPDNLLGETAILFRKDPSWIVKVSENKKKKEQALAAGDRESWNRIMDEERQYLKQTAFDSD